MRRVEMMGYSLVGSTAGSIIGPSLGGLLFEWGGFSLPSAVFPVLVGILLILRAAREPLLAGERQAVVLIP